MFREQKGEIDENICPELSVLILTKDRPALLTRAVTSISKQNFEGRIQVLIVGDDCPYVKPAMFGAEFPQLHLRLINISGDIFNDVSTLERIARLRNLALSQVSTEYIAFLDDDNQWAQNHLSSLYKTMIETGCPAVHSWRILVDEHDQEIVVDSFPWLQDRIRAVERFEISVELGLMSEGVAVVRDRHEAVYNYVDYGMVDCGEWLFRRSLFQRFGFRTDFSKEDDIYMIGEDDKLLLDLKKKRVPIACTQIPTLFYTLGGMSNHYTGKIIG